MVYCGSSDGGYHAQVVSAPLDAYQRHPAPPVPGSWRHNPPHPDYALQGMHPAPDVASVHQYSTPASTPSAGRAPARKNARKEQPVERAGAQAQRACQGRRVARVFPRRKAGEDKRSTDTPVILTKEMLQPLFAIPLRDAAEMMGLCPTALKSVCRRLGIDRWPFQQRRGGSAVSRASKNKEAKEAAQRLMNPQAVNALPAYHAMQNFSSSPTDSMSSDSSDSATTCSTAATETAEQPEVADVPSNANNAWSKGSEPPIKIEAGAEQHCPPPAFRALPAQHHPHEVEVPHASEGPKFEAIAHGIRHQHHHPHPHTHEVSQQQHGSDEWGHFDQRPSQELFPSLFGHLPWEHKGDMEVSSCDMSFLTVRI